MQVLMISRLMNSKLTLFSFTWHLTNTMSIFNLTSVEQLQVTNVYKFSIFWCEQSFNFQIFKMYQSRYYMG